jgi:restriction system protein
MMARHQGAFSDSLEVTSNLPESLLVAARANPKAELGAMSWRDFERLIGEAFRQRGYTVTGFGGNADSGVDLGLMKNAERFLVQCKHWRKHQVGVTVVRELDGVIAAQRAHGGFVVTGGEFAREARDFAQTCAIELIDGSTLENFIRHVPVGSRSLAAIA